MSTTLIVPGLNGSGPDHWQSWWQGEDPEAIRVEQSDWVTPDLAVWAATVGEAMDRAVGPLWIVAHSFGCLASVKAAVGRTDRVAGLFLVAPADPLKFKLLEQLPVTPLSVPGLLVASSDDPWMRLMNALWWAERWGFGFHNMGAVGHINPESGFGPWPQGKALFDNFSRRQMDWLQGDIPDEFHLIGTPE